MSVDSSNQEDVCLRRYRKYYFRLTKTRPSPSAHPSPLSSAEEGKIDGVTSTRDPLQCRGRRDFSPGGNQVGAYSLGVLTVLRRLQKK